MKKEPGLAGRIFKAVGKAGDAVGKILTTAGQAAGTTGQRAALTFASSAKGQPIPQHTCKELAGRMANDLASPLECMQERYHVLSGTFLFVFTPSLDDSTFVVDPSKQIAYIALTWPPGLLEVDPSLSLFVWNRGLRLGPRSAAADQVSLWIKSWLGFVFDSRELLEKPPLPGPKGLFIGRQGELDRLAATLADQGPDRKWIVSLTAHGGAGKSYFLERFERRYQARMLYAQLDHQNVEAAAGALTSLTGLIQALALKFARGGCATPRFDKAYALFARTLSSESQPPEKGMSGFLRKAVRSGSRVFPVIGAAEASLNLYDSLADEARKEAEALANSSWVQKLTTALVEDLTPFVRRQQADYLLWRRPVLVFDTYELLAVIVDTWLRVCLLKNRDFVALSPLVIMAGRQGLMRVDTRWSEHQEATMSLLLEPFEEEESRAYFQALGTPPDTIDSYLPLTGGLPLFISLVAQCQSSDSAVRLLTGRVLEEVEPELRPRLLEAAVADGFNRDTLARLLDPGCDLAQTYEGLTRCTFVESRQGKWHFAPLVRRLLHSSLQMESPDRLRELQARLE